MSTPAPTIITLPFPPSTNNLFINVQGGGRRIAPAYRKWRANAGWQLKSCLPTKVTGQVAILVELVPQSKRKADADNFNKAVLDLLVMHEIIEADDWSVVRDIRCVWRDEGPECRVTISPIMERVAA